MTLDVEAIEVLCKIAGRHRSMHIVKKEVPALIAEVRRLRAENLRLLSDASFYKGMADSFGDSR